MASVQALKEIHVVHTISAKECGYQASGGEWIKPSENNPTAKLVKATWFKIAAGKTVLKLKRLRSVTVGFEISISDGTPSMKDGNVGLSYALRANNGGAGGVAPVQDQINNMEPNSKTWISLTFEMYGRSLETIDFSLENSTAVGGLTFYQAKVEEMGEE